ncbi:MAG: NAD(P)/FAD-dependent oxidoreductase [Spirochaetes bacterium]|nr:NAD(P)/FAD-dependent oxidoreductase [Spirochaetota bacterium]
MEKTGITIIGAGAVGLAIGAALSRTHDNIIIVEKNGSFGRETSSRNSEVIHAGIYYPENSLKATFCVKGKELLYEFLKKYSIPYKQCGKFIVAVEKEEVESLFVLKDQGKKNGVEDITFVENKKIRQAFPGIISKAGLFSPSTGIFDTHKFMQALEMTAEENNVLISYNSEVIQIEKEDHGYKITVREGDNRLEFLSEVIINSAGLHSQIIAEMLEIKSEEHTLYYAKGEYFALSSKYKDFSSSLMYPVVPVQGKSLGIHTVLDLQGMLKLGPNIHYIKDIDYTVEPSHLDEFFTAVKRYFPFIEKNELSPDMAGIRPKRQGPDDPFKDFLIREETEKGFPGFINLIGIESPGLTGSLAIAEYVEYLLR